MAPPFSSVPYIIEGLYMRGLVFFLEEGSRRFLRNDDNMQSYTDDTFQKIV
jgi:hypothetical protein